MSGREVGRYEATDWANDSGAMTVCRNDGVLKYFEVRAGMNWWGVGRGPRVINSTRYTQFIATGVSIIAARLLWKRIPSPSLLYAVFVMHITCVIQFANLPFLFYVTCPSIPQWIIIPNGIRNKIILQQLTKQITINKNISTLRRHLPPLEWHWRNQPSPRPWHRRHSGTTDLFGRPENRERRPRLVRNHLRN